MESQYLINRRNQMLGIKPKAPPKGKNPDKPKKEIPKRSKKMKGVIKEVKKLYEIYLAKPENQICLIQSPVCTKVATVVNHKRRRGANIANVKDWEPCCPACNGYIENHTSWAVKNGHLISAHKIKSK